MPTIVKYFTFVQTDRVNAHFKKHLNPIPLELLRAKIIPYMKRRGKKSYFLFLRYDPEEDEWTIMEKMRRGRSSFALETINGTLTAIGGWNVSQGVYENQLLIIVN